MENEKIITKPNTLISKSHQKDQKQAVEKEKQLKIRSGNKINTK